MVSALPETTHSPHVMKENQLFLLFLIIKYSRLITAIKTAIIAHLGRFMAPRAFIVFCICTSTYWALCTNVPGASTSARNGF